jgi:hypothetical protein
MEIANVRNFGNGIETEKTVPMTPRGRALYTVDWFLNGKPVLRNHDNPNLKLTEDSKC